MKSIVLCFLLVNGFLITIAQKQMIVVTNPLPVLREEVIEIPWKKIISVYPNLDTSGFKVMNSASGKELPFQLEYKGENAVQNLLVLVTIGAGKAIKLQLQKGKPRTFPSRTYARYVPERKDDFAWENDRIAHRVYGKALESTPAEMAYGIDVWVKRTDSLIIDSRYKRGNYHADNGDGLDYYHVGLTLGAGGIAPYINDTIWYAKTYDTWKVLDNGPIRSSFVLTYSGWNAAGRKVSMKKTVSIDAGSQLSKTQVVYTTDSGKGVPVVAGIIKRKEAGEMLLNEKDGILAYWEPRHGNDGITGVACLLATPVSGMQVKGGHLLAETLTADNGSITYYHGAAWDKAGKIVSASEWFKYLESFQESLKNQLTISIRQ